MSVFFSRSRTIALSFVALGFLAGAAAGVAGDRLMARKVVRVRIDDMSGVLDKLGLTPEQRRQADSIIARSAPRSEAILVELGERLRAVADSLDRDLRGILTPEQRARLDGLRTGPRMLLKRKTTSGTIVDTLFDSTRKRR